MKVENGRKFDKIFWYFTSAKLKFSKNTILIRKDNINKYNTKVLRFRMLGSIKKPNNHPSEVDMLQFQYLMESGLLEVMATIMKLWKQQNSFSGMGPELMVQNFQIPEVDIA